MKNSLKENLERNFRENVIPVVLPVVYQIKGRIAEGLDKKFPKESRDEVVRKVLTNLLSAKETLEKTAKDVAEQSKDSEIVRRYVRPIVKSEKTEKALHNLETRVSRAKPLVTKLQSLREQFLASTNGKKQGTSQVSAEVGEIETAQEVTTPKRRKSRSKSDTDA
jgi:hypothetical protein